MSEENGKVCCNCRHCKRVKEDNRTVCRRDCPFASIDLPTGCAPDEDGNCYLCVRSNIDWEVRHE